LNDRARSRGAVGRLNYQDLKEVLEKYGQICYYCKIELDFMELYEDGQRQTATFDHVERIYDGGSNTKDNLVPACNRCNNNHAKNKITHKGKTQKKKVKKQKVEQLRLDFEIPKVKVGKKRMTHDRLCMVGACVASCEIWQAYGGSAYSLR